MPIKIDLNAAKADGGVLYDSIKPSQFSEIHYDLNGKPLSFEKHPHIVDPLNDGAREQILIYGRQTGKSITMALKELCFASLMPYAHILHVSPTMKNRTQFEKDKLVPFMMSPSWRHEYYNNEKIDNMERKELINNSVIHLRNVYRNTVSVRGISAGPIFLDEVQDIAPENISVIRECQSAQEFKMVFMAGTQASLQSATNYYWNLSDQKEFCIKCSHCGVWNVLDEKNISPKCDGMICRRCNGDMVTLRDKWAWVKHRETSEISGYRFPQIAYPNQDWKSLKAKLRTYSKARLYNEILALPYDFSGKPISEDEVKATATGADHWYEPHEVGGFRTFCGIDWGSGTDQSATVISILVERQNMKAELIFSHKFMGEGSDPAAQEQEIKRIIEVFHPTLICADHGFGDQQNKILYSYYNQGVDRYNIVYLSHNQKEIIKKNKGEMFWTASRTQTLTDTFLGLKRRDIILPQWNVVEDYAQDILNVYTEPSSDGLTQKYKHPIDKPDDSLQSLNFAFIAFGIALGKYQPRQNGN